MSLFTTLLLARVQERGGRAGDQVRSDQELPRPAFTTPRSLKMRSACMVGWVGMLAARSAGHSSLINPISRNSVDRNLPQWANGTSSRVWRARTNQRLRLSANLLYIVR